MPVPDYCYTGLPQWHHPDWGQSALHGNRQATPLARYASHFTSVEGNSTFYALPDTETVQRWNADTPADFRFCFKFPKRVSHELKLRHCDTELRDFFDRLAPLETKLGLLYLQFPANFGPDALPRLGEFLRQLPGDFRYGLEVRHPEFFAKGEEERALNRLLLETGINRTLFDTRALFALPATDPATLDALQKKPRVPLHVIATGSAPMIRFIAPQDYHQGLDWLEPWVGKVAAWLDEGRTPFMFFHTPDNAESPELARLFSEKLVALRSGVRGFTAWPDSLRQQETLFS